MSVIKETNMNSKKSYAYTYDKHKNVQVTGKADRCATSSQGGETEDYEVGSISEALEPNTVCLRECNVNGRTGAELDCELEQHLRSDEENGPHQETLLAFADVDSPGQTTSVVNSPVQTLRVPDGGWGWLVAVSSFVIMVSLLQMHQEYINARYD